MPGVYGLLPLANYFNTVLDPVVEFEDTALAKIYRDAYGDSINTAAELQSFLLGGGDGRAKPQKEDTLTPNILNSALLVKSLATRNSLEAWGAPSGVEVHQIAGWGLDTIKSSKYYERCTNWHGVENCFLDMKPLFTSEGDATVVSPSASAIDTASTHFLNLHAFNTLHETNWSHANVLAATPAQNLIEKLLTGANDATPFITENKPEESNLDKRLQISVHSPVSLEVRDALGRLTGIIDNPDPGSDIPIVVQEIPNSLYLEFGEGKYIRLDGNEERKIHIEGEDEGVFTLEIEEIENNLVVGKVSYSNVEVSGLTMASLRIKDSAQIGDLEIDRDGDGEVDEIIKPDGENLTPEEMLEEFRNTVLSLKMHRAIRYQLVIRSRMAQRFITNGNVRIAKMFLKQTENFLKQQKGRHIKKKDAKMLIKILKDIREMI